MELSEGRVIDAAKWPLDADAKSSATTSLELAAGADRGPGPNGSWRLGKQPAGRMRVRVEAPLDAVVIVRGGDDLSVALPLLAILEKPQHTPQQSPLVVSVERLAWDPLSIEFGKAAHDGIVAPGTEIPVTVGYNILWPESSEAAVRTSAIVRPLRGGEPLGRYEPRERDVVATNRLESTGRTWSIKAPLAEGTYVLEVSSSWASMGTREGSVIGRFIRRRRPAAVPSSATRRVVFTVVEPAASKLSAASEGHGRATDVDAIDLTRSRIYRPLAAGRSAAAEPGHFAWSVPAAAMIEPSRRDLLLGWITRTGAEASKLDPANASGLAWSAMGLKVAHPDRPHRLTIKVRGGEPAALGVALIEPGGAGETAQPRLLLDACASGPPILVDGPAATFSWLVWPRAAEIALVLINRSSEAEVRLGTITLAELDGLPPAPAPAPIDARGADARMLGLYFSDAHAIEPFGGDRATYDPVKTAQNLVRYLQYCGASAVVLPERFGSRSHRRALDGQLDEDSTGPDQLEITRRLLARAGLSIWLELGFDGPDALPGLPPPDSAEAIERGLARIDREGKPDGSAYHPLHPDVREAMKRRVTQALVKNRLSPPGDPRKKTGVLIRLGRGSTLLGTPDTGLDDLTYERFVRESFSVETARSIPGFDKADPNRFAVRGALSRRDGADALAHVEGACDRCTLHRDG